MLLIIKSLIPKKLFNLFRPFYHYTLAFLGAIWYRFPSKKIIVVGVTGTKGKSTVVELLTTTLKVAGYKVASTSTIGFSLGNETIKNKYKMTMPGRFFMQNFLSKAVKKNCSHAILEMTSEGAKQYRHAFIEMDGLVFLNLSPEHIDSHGSYEKYKQAKLKLAKSLEKSKKSNRFIIVNSDDKEAERFASIKVERKDHFSLKQTQKLTESEKGLSFLYKDQHVVSSLRGIFNASNICAVFLTAEHLGVPYSVTKRAVALKEKIKGRVEEVNVFEKQPFKVYVDYAHTPDSLKKLYETFKENKVCVLGSAGGGRDVWKRPEMGKIADRHCEHIILTDEDPYDENPEKIVKDIKKGIKIKTPEIIMDRRKAINTALNKALRLSEKGEKVSVLITGKGTDPYIMRSKGKKEPWSDVEITSEELEKILSSVS
jgi:UDP-N-acetylmuramoyl-L-alanyl-D-glutamate--2,6-diaminopimelate ligase